MRTPIRSIGLVTVLSLAGVSCVDTGAFESSAAKISDDVNVLEREPGVDVTVEDGRLIFPYGDDVAGVAAGQVLVSGRGGGFLRRATAVEEIGGEIHVTTEPASLTDAIIDGEVTETVEMEPAYREDAPWAGAWGGDGMGGFAVGLGGTTIVANGDISVTIPEGRLDFTPRMDFALDIERRRLKEFRMIASGEVDAALSMDVRIENGYAAGRYMVPLWQTHKMFMQMVGIVPVVEMVELKLGVGVQVDAMGAAHASFGGSLHASIAAGARFEQGEWHAVGDKMISFQVLPLVMEGDGMAAVRGFVYAEVAVMFYDVVGPALMVMPYAAAAYEQPGGWRPRVGVMGMFEAMVSLPIVDKSWVGYQAMLFDVYQDLGGRQMSGAGDSPVTPGHTEHGGAGSPSPSGGHSGH